MAGEKEAYIDWLVQSMRWPLIRRMLETDHTVATIAKALGEKPSQVERSLTSPRVTMRRLGRIAHALGVHLNFELVDRGTLPRAPKGRSEWPYWMARPRTWTARAALSQGGRGDG